MPAPVILIGPGDQPMQLRDRDEIPKYLKQGYRYQDPVLNQDENVVSLRFSKQADIAKLPGMNAAKARRMAHLRSGGSIDMALLKTEFATVDWESLQRLNMISF